jgi:hypothetical protein
VDDFDSINLAIQIWECALILFTMEVVHKPNFTFVTP